MSSVLDQLTKATAGRSDGIDVPWGHRLEQSMARDPGAWVEAAYVDPALGEDDAWRLLGFVEMATSVVVRERRPALVQQAALALALLEDGPLDHRDVLVVADLLPRACTLSGVDLAQAIRHGCAPAGPRGLRCRRWLLQRPAATLSTWEETGSGGSSAFRRVPAGFDPDDLLRRLERHRRPT